MKNTRQFFTMVDVITHDSGGVEYEQGMGYMIMPIIILS